MNITFSVSVLYITFDVKWYLFEEVELNILIQIILLHFILREDYFFDKILQKKNI